MDLEAPVDAWYVWFAVALLSVSIGGVALSLPSEPAPDADRAVNAIEEGTTSSYNVSASYDHDADEVRIDTIRLAMRNDGGTDRATLAFGNMTPVLEHPDEAEAQRGIDVALGEDPSNEFDNASEMAEWAAEISDATEDSAGEWRPANDVLHVRTVNWGETRVTFVYV